MDGARDPAWRSEVARAFQENRTAMYRVARALLFGTGLEDEAEDIVSTAISEVLAGGPRPVDRWQGYLVRIVQRRALDLLKSAEVRHRDEREAELDAATDGIDPADDAGDGIDTLVLIERAKAALERLDPSKREIARSHLWLGQSQTEIAQRLGISQPRVSQIIQEARTAIQIEVEGGNT